MDVQILFRGRRPEQDRTIAGSRGPRHGGDEPPGPEPLSHVPGPLRVGRRLAPQPLLLH